MISLKNHLKNRAEGKPDAPNPAKRANLRDRLLQREISELCSISSGGVLPQHCNVTFPDPNCLHKMLLCVQPTEGYWKGGSFQFEIDVPEGYNMVPPKVKCLTRVWHPNILDGNVCLSVLRNDHGEGMGWTPTRTIKEVVLGLDALFSDLLNFSDPLNQQAADQRQMDEDAFKRTVHEYMYSEPSKRYRYFR